MSLQNKCLILLVVGVLLFSVDTWVLTSLQPSVSTDIALEQMNDNGSQAVESLRMIEVWKNYIGFGVMGLTTLALFWGNLWQGFYQLIGSTSD